MWRQSESETIEAVSSCLFVQNVLGITLNFYLETVVSLKCTTGIKIILSVNPGVCLILSVQQFFCESVINRQTIFRVYIETNFRTYILQY